MEGIEVKVTRPKLAEGGPDHPDILEAQATFAMPGSYTVYVKDPDTEQEGCYIKGFTALEKKV